jgi:hypothetical protein
MSLEFRAEEKYIWVVMQVVSEGPFFINLEWLGVGVAASVVWIIV